MNQLKFLLIKRIMVSNFQKIRRTFIYTSLIFSGLTEVSAQQSTTHPNVVWILIENIGPEFSCYGYPQVKTPNIDRLATEGVLFKNAFTNAPVCSPSRSSLITGMYQNAFGAHHHRSHNTLPDSVKTIPELFRGVGYFTALGNGYQGKTDYNFCTKDRVLWDGSDWSQRKEGQPFFAQLTINNSHRGMHWHNPIDPNSWMHDKYRDLLKPVDPQKIELPAIIPDNFYIRADWASYLNQIQVVDYLVGDIISRLKKEGVYENTLIILMGDNGRDFIRNEYWLYDGGLHVPLIIVQKGAIEPNTIREDLVSGVDISVSLLNVCGIAIPDYMHGIPFMGENSRQRKHIFAARDRINDAYDMIRSIRTEKFRYIYNFMAERPYTQHRGWLMHFDPAFPLIKYMVNHAPHELNLIQKQYTASEKPVEELYDITNDPEQLNNLAKNPEYKTEIINFRKRLKEWMLAIDDKARISEKPEDVREVSFKEHIIFPSSDEQYNHSMLKEF